MKPFSNFIIAFILAVATTCLVYAFSRILFSSIAPSEVEIRDNDESQLY